MYGFAARFGAGSFFVNGEIILPDVALCGYGSLLGCRASGAIPYL